MKKILGFREGSLSEEESLVSRHPSKKGKDGDESKDKASIKAVVRGLSGDYTKEDFEKLRLRRQESEIDPVQSRFTQAFFEFNSGILTLKKEGKMTDEMFSKFSILSNPNGSLLDNADDLKIALNELIEEFSKDVIQNEEVLKLCNDFLDTVVDLPNTPKKVIIKGFSSDLD